MKNALTTIATIEEIRQLSSELKKNMLLLGKMIATRLDAFPESRDDLIEAIGGNAILLGRFEMLGREQIHEQLVFSSSVAEHRLSRLPLSEQRAVLESGIPVLESDGVNHRVIRVEQLSGEQVKQVFRKSGLRSLASQRTYIQERKIKATPAVLEKDYQVGHDSVVVLRPVKFTRQQLAQILAQIS